MEKESITLKIIKSSILRKFIWVLPLALPIAGVIYFDGTILAETELGDPVNLYIDVPLPMSMVHYSLVAALILVFTPFKRIMGMCIGLALGGICFYGLDQYDQLRDLSSMGLSSTPLIEMITISREGKWFIASMGLCVVTQLIYGIADIIQLWQRRNKTD